MSVGDLLGQIESLEVVGLSCTAACQPMYVPSAGLTPKGMPQQVMLPAGE